MGPGDLDPVLVEKVNFAGFIDEGEEAQVRVERVLDARGVASTKTWPFISLPSPSVNSTYSRTLGIFGMRAMVSAFPHSRPFGRFQRPRRP